ncbi:MAG: glycosyltransferase [Acidobacteriota bacterium]
MPETPDNPRLSVIVPTLGLSRWLLPCLEALRRDGGEDLEIVLVSQGRALEPSAESIADQVLRLPENRGFAAATNAGLARARGAFLATVNDDAIVAEGWCEHLLGALEGHPAAAAVQGLNLSLHDPQTIDGGGLAWNRYWQAVQIGHGQPQAILEKTIVEVFGVSATAAIYRRTALEQVASANLAAFEPRLFAYYEDVDLACRLRGAGYVALRVPQAETRHAGSVSGQQLLGGAAKWIYGNRQLVLARLLGRTFWWCWPRILVRDLVDLWHSLGRGDWQTASGILAGCARFLRHGHAFVRFGASRLSLGELRRFCS